LPVGIVARVMRRPAMIQPPRVRTRAQCRERRSRRSRPGYSVEGLAAEIDGLFDMHRELRQELDSLKNTPRLHRKDLCRRYGVSLPTIHRWMRRGLLPRPVQFSGPLWPLADILAAEAAGRLPCPKSA
jgi:predicted DNA-binding transcriptional regulator AlpA